jgi:hypothetical protein
MTYTPSPAEIEMVDTLSRRVFEYKVLSIKPEGLKDALQVGGNTSRSCGWVHIGHVRTEQKYEPIVNIFFARIIPLNSVGKPTRLYQLQHVVTVRLPNQKLHADHEGWLSLVTKRWSAFDKEVSKDYCVTFFARPKRATPVVATRKDVSV